MKYPKKISIVEVGLRDGLQNEKIFLSTKQRIQFAEKLIEAGLRRIELGAFVRHDWVPQMAGSAEIIQSILSRYGKNIQASALVPNERGLQDALQTEIPEVSLFGSASQSFSYRNINCSIEESFKKFANVIATAKKHKRRVRGYLSTCFQCPFEGRVSEKKVVELAHQLYKMGCYEISIGDTIGVATPYEVQSLFKQLKKKIPGKFLAGHFHDTRGMALANILAAMDLGIAVFDTSLGGLGGCPYAPAATGNVATEEVVYMLNGFKIETGIDLDLLIQTNHWVSAQMSKNLPSRVGLVGLLVPQGKIESKVFKTEL